jgi:WD40 repeat protein
MRPLAPALALALACVCASTGACGGSESARPAHPTSPTAAASGGSGAPGAPSAARACATPPATPLAPLSTTSTFPSAEFQASRDGHVVVARATPAEVQVWNVPKGVKVATLGSTVPIDHFALRPDGRALATFSDGHLVARDLEHGTWKPLPIDPGSVTGLRWTSDGRLLVVGRTSATDFVDAAGGKVASTVPALAVPGGVAPDGRSMLARDGVMLDAASRAVRWKSPTAPAAAAFSDDGRLVALSTEKPDDPSHTSTTITVVDAATGAKRWTVTAGGRATGVTLNRDGASLAAFDSGSDKPGAQRGVTLWTRGKRVHAWASGDERREAHPSFSADGTRLAFLSTHVGPMGNYDYRIDFVHSADGTPVRLAETPAVAPEIWSDMFTGPLTWTDDGRSLLQGGRGGISIVDATRGSHRVVGVASYASETRRRDAALAPDGSAIVVVEDQPDRQGSRSVARIFDLATGALRASLDSRATSKARPPPEFLSVDFSPDGGVIALSRVDGVLLWDGRSDRVSYVLEDDPPAGFVREAAFAPDGRLLATYSGAANAIHLTDPRSGKRVQTLALDDATPNDVAFSRDGTRVAVAVSVKDDRNGSHGEMRLYDPQSGALVRTLHPGARDSSVNGTVQLNWGPTGRAIVSVGSTVELWNATSDDPPDTLLEGVQPGPAVLSRDGNLLAMGRLGLGVWDLRTQKLVREVGGDGTPVMRVRVEPGGDVVAVVRVDHVDLYRLADGAHATLRDGDVAGSASGMLMFTDDGAFMGDATAYRAVQVRDGASLIEARAIRAEEVDALRRPSLGRDFMAGCPTAAGGDP